MVTSGDSAAANGDGDDGALDVDGRGQAQLVFHGSGPVVGRNDFGRPSSAVDPADGVDLKGQLIPVGIGIGIGPVGIKRSV